MRTIIALSGSKAPPGPIRPSRTINDENWRARMVSESGEGATLANWWQMWAWRCRSPPKVTVVAASKAKCIGATGAGRERRSVVMGCAPPTASPPVASSMATEPSDEWSGWRTAKQNGWGACAGR